MNSMILILLSRLFQVLSAAYRLLFFLGILRANKLPGKTISIGNLAVGGTGKTPVVIELAKTLIKDKKSVCVLTRGYKSGMAKGDVLVLRAGKTLYQSAKLAQVFADEAMLTSISVPECYVVVGVRRYEAAQVFLSLGLANPDYWLLDDGFQHLRLARDFDIVLLDAKKPFGNEKLLPAGPLRELPSALKRSNLILLTRAEETADASHVAFIKKLGKKALALRFDSYEMAQDTKKIGKKPILCAGIAQPRRLLASLAELGIDVAHILFKGDHERFKPSDFPSDLSSYSSVLTTAKDFYRDPSLFASLPIPVCVLNLKIDWPEASLLSLIPR